ncbi:MAG TPA: UbiA family prenyltransferase [Polyangiaceae bacterium]|nr:UbiA family prenyltransferase [Polyangiaceae bacterium]
MSRPLCVDLDGTLVTTDTLWEGVMLLFRRRPWVVVVAPFWLLGGRARFKRAVAESAGINPASLPYRLDLLEALRASRARGRQLVLATAAHRTVAEGVARHLDLFDAIHASDGESNLKGTTKRDMLKAAYGERGFDYVGDSSADEPILEAATQGYLVGASRGAEGVARRLGSVTLVSRRPNFVRALIKQLRVHQWAKNALVLLPLLLAPDPISLAAMTHGILAFIAFSLCASAGYVFNDLMDIEADRAHHSKKNRPFASGALPVILGVPLLLVLLLGSFGLSATLLSNRFSMMLALYLVGTLSYSFYLKRKLLLDVLVLAGLYTHRILSGGVATEIRVSAWLLGFSMFLFTSLAFAKRYVELRALAVGDSVMNRGYSKTDLEMVTSMGTASGYIAALVFMLYVDSAAVRASYREPALLWLVLPVLLYWLGRLWLLAGRGQMQDDPVKFALKDPHSLACGAVIGGIAALARFAPPWLTALLPF